MNCSHIDAVPVHRWRREGLSIVRYVAWLWCHACRSKVDLEVVLDTRVPPLVTR